MARRMPRLDMQFTALAQGAVDLALAGERIRSAAPAGSLFKTELSLQRLEAIYETGYLRVFLAWEEFLEQTFLRYICGYVSALGSCTLIGSAFPNIADANGDVLGTRDFVSWADPRQVIRRSQTYTTLGFHETVLNSDLSRLLLFKSVRNRIAHSSEHARNEFDSATRTLTSKRYPASSPGRFLRDRAVTMPFPKSWLELVTDELVSLSVQVCS
jgi:hypothetical protein